jgi:predicted GH43/DUF377 family glycosyl hydrolase
MTKATTAMHHVDAELRPDPARVIGRLFLPGESAGGRSRAGGVVARVLALDEAEVLRLAAQLVEGYADRHRDYLHLLGENASIVSSHLPRSTPMSTARTIVMGASFTSEYATEAAALCNPSAFAHPDQNALAAGQLRVAVSLRGIGEGHLSCIGFASAVIGPGPQWSFEPRATPVVAGVRTSTITPESMYEVGFPADVTLSQRVLVPSAAEESNGMEDARFVRFAGEDGAVDYRATYTAYDGRQIAPRILTSPDLQTFRAHHLTGPAAQNKGMALFPRLVGGRHMALCRSDGESNWLSTSADGFAWGRPRRLVVPELWWEVLQIGNCGPPIETDRGWLVLTHGVGPMRAYVIGAILLDLEDPTIVLGRLGRPLLQAGVGERDGYVPNVVYSCGGLVHDGRLWLPYGISDARIGVAWASLDELLDEMTSRYTST